MSLWAPNPKPAPDYAQLEDRLLLSAVPLPPSLGGGEFAVDWDHASTAGRAEPGPSWDTEFSAAVPEWNVPSDSAALDSPTIAAAEQLRRELVVVDPAASNYQQLVDDLLSQQGDSRQFEIVVLDRAHDGIEQISQILAGRVGLAAVHIVSHGSEGAVQLGNSSLSLNNVGSYAGQLVGWREALAAEADLLFYGCNLASNPDGQLLVESLGTLCDCDVAASSDDTGHKLLGGDWELEYSQGSIETAVAFSQDLQQSWGHLLNVAVDNTSTGTSGGGDFSVSHTTSGTDRLMLVGVSINHAASNSVDEITYNGDALTRVGFQQDGDARVEVWSLVNPDLGTFNVDINIVGNSDGNTAGVMTFVGVDQTTPLGTFSSGAGIGGSGSATISSAVNELVFATISVDDSTDYDLDPGAGQAEIWDLTGGGEINGGGSTEAGAASVLMDWTWGGSDNWAVGGVSIKPASANVAPTIGLPGAAVNFTEGGGATIIDAAATLSDADSPDFATGTLTVDFSAGGTANDRLGINDEGPGGGNISLSGSSVRYDFGGGPTTIGTFAGGTSGADPLLITFNASSDVTSARAVMRNITYDNAAVDPDTDSRTVRFVLTDGDGGTSNTVSETINVGGDNTLVVTTAADILDAPVATSIDALLADRGADDHVSLREAMLAVNGTANGGSPDRIEFDLFGAGPHTIALSSALPTITEAVLIDGTSEPDFAGSPVVRIDGDGIGGAADGLSFNATSDGSTVRGLMITRFSRDGILVQSGADNITIAGNWIGTDGTPSPLMGNADDGIDLRGSTAVIGGTGGNDRNVITNSADEGITIVGSGATNHLLQGNYIGLNVDGTAGSGNADVGLAIISGSGNTIGGTTAAARNVISNNFEGLEINTDGNTVQGNYVGTDPTGAFDRGNRSDDGIEIQSNASNNLIGGTSAGAGNLIAFNQHDGVFVASGSDNAVRGNVIHSNNGLALDLGTNGVTGNDAGDGDTGANDLQNFPVLTKAATSGTTIFVAGTLDSAASSTFDVDFYASAAQDPSGHGEAEQYLGSTSVATDASGYGRFHAVISAAVPAGRFVTATATDAAGNTSEFAANVASYAVTNSLWLNTKDDVVSSGAPGLDRWTDGEVLDFGDPNLTLEPGGTNGTFSSVMNFDAVFDSGDVDIGSLHFVSRDVTVGSGLSTFDLLTGDLLFSFEDDDTIGAANYEDNDLHVFRPAAPGDYSSGTVSLLLDNLADFNIRAVSLVERDVTVGDVTLNAGEFLYTDNNYAAEIRHFAPTGVGLGTTTGLKQTFLNASGAFNLVEDIGGLELIEFGTSIGDEAITAGTILATVAEPDLVGNGPGLSVDDSDIFRLAVSTTVMGSGTSDAMASLLMDGSLVSLSDGSEDVVALALFDPATNQSPVLTLPAGAVNYTENDPATVIDSSATLNDPDSADFAAGALTVDFALNGAANDRLDIRDQGAGAGNISLAGSDVRYDFGAGPVVIGSYVGGSSGSDPLVVTLNASSDDPSVEALMRNIRYRNVSDNPSTLSRTVRFVLDDGDGGSSNAETELINVTARNDAPAVTDLAGDVLAYNRGSGPLVIENGADALVSDLDSNDFDTGNVTVTFFSGSDPSEDVLSVRDEGLAPGQLGFDGSQVRFGGVLIGTAAGGSGGADLVISLNANATPTAVTALVRNITYENTDAVSPATGPRTVRFTIDDGDGDTSSNYDTTVNVNANLPPTLTNLAGDTLAYTEGDGVRVIEQGGDVMASDVDSADFNTGNLTVSIAAGGDASEDVLSIRDQGVGVGQIGFDGSNVTYSGTLIGTAAGGLGGADLVVTFNANADAAKTGALIENITYQNTDTGNPTATARTVRFTVADGDGATSSPRDATVTVAATNDPPALASLEAAPLAYIENNPPTPLTTSISLSDVDDSSLESAVIRLTGNYAAGEDLLAFTDTPSIAGSWNALTGGLTLSGSDTLANYQAALRAVTYQNTSDDPNPATRTVRFTVNDGDDTSNPLTRNVTVTAQNDAPTTTDLAGDVLSYSSGAGAVVVENGADAVVSDMDSNDFDTGNVTVAFVTGSDSSEDVLSIRDQGLAPGQIGFDGSNVRFGGALIGTAAGGGGGVDLVITLNSNATPTAVTSLLRNITYENTDTISPTTGPRTARFTVNDGDGGNSPNYDATVNLNLPPTVNDLAGDTLAYTEGDGVRIIEQGGDVTTSDVDSADFDTGNLTVSIAAGGDASEDVLSIRDQGVGVGQIGFDGSNVTYSGTLIGTAAGGWGGADLVVTFNANADAAKTGALIENITYENTDTGNPTATVRAVRFTVADGDGAASSPRDATVTVGATNDSPALASLEAAPLAYIENDPPTPLTTSISISDVDDSNIELAVIRLTGNYNAGEDLLAFADTPSITGSWDALTGRLTLSGSDTLANYQAALRAVTYQNTSDDPNPATRTVSFSVDDGDGTSNIPTRSINITPQNDPPIATDDNATANGGETLSASPPGVLGNDTDIDADPLSANLVSAPSHGTVIVNTDGSFSYTSLASYSGADSFVYQVSDGAGGLDTATVHLTVQAVAGPPPSNEPPPDDGSSEPSVENSEEEASEDETQSEMALTPPEPTSNASTDPGRVARRPTGISPHDEQLAAQFAVARNKEPDELSDAHDPLVLDLHVEPKTRRLSGAVRVASTGAAQVAAFIDPDVFWDRLDDFQEGLQDGGQPIKLVVGSVAMASLAVTATYVVWTVKGGYLLASMLSQMPAWRFVDPLPIFDAHTMANSQDEDEEPLLA